jgi:uncharacterized protein (UPF0210 family)
MTYKVIPQVDYDRSVQKILGLGLGRVPAENIVMALWKASQDLGLNFKLLIEKATANGKLNVDQSILDRINSSLPETIRYNKKTAVAVSSVATREL